MGQRKTRKKWSAVLLTGLMAAGLLLQSLNVQAASSETSGSNTKNGTFHIDQFGEYDINTAVTVDGGKITGLTVIGENFGGTYADVNRRKLDSAVNGIVDKIIGLDAGDAEAISGVDAVSGATVSSNGIKNSVLNALALDQGEEGPPEAPEAIAEGMYSITVSVRSDVVDHSLVQTDTAKAALAVDKDGRMQLSYRMVSGTDKEPMYILGFNGYYINNDDSMGLTMEGASYSTEQSGDYTVVTDVSFPLSGMSSVYYNNVSIFVPAMSNLNGLINGIEFENGKFSVKAIVTLYWDTLTAKSSQNSEKSMEISANVAEKISTPSYTISVPSSIVMGALNNVSDNIQEYDIKVETTDKEGVITVTAPEGGLLYNGSHTLAFSNNFGTQTVDTAEGDSGAQALTAIGAEGDDVALHGTIRITAVDVAAAAPGNYTGTTTFTITYKNSGETPDVKNLKDGVYSVTGYMVKPDKKTLSMSDNAINHTVKLTVKDGKYYLTVDFKGLTIGEKLGYLSGLKYFTTGYTMDSYGNPTGNLAEVTVDSYQKNEDGSLVSDDFGTNYPDIVTFELIPEALNDGYVPLQVFVPIMDSISVGTGTQPVFLALDWSTLKAAEDNDPSFGEEDPPSGGGSLGGGSSLGGGGSLGGNGSLGGGSLNGGASLNGGSSLSGGSSLGNSSLNSSSLKSGTAVKTGDASSVNGAAAVLLLSGTVVALTAVFLKRRFY